MLVSAGLRTARPCPGHGSGTVFGTKPVTGFRPWPGTKRRRTFPSLGLLSPLVTPCCLCHGSFPVFLGRGLLITFHCLFCFALPLSCSALCFLFLFSPVFPNVLPGGVVALQPPHTSCSRYDTAIEGNLPPRQGMRTGLAEAPGEPGLRSQLIGP